MGFYPLRPITHSSRRTSALDFNPLECASKPYFALLHRGEYSKFIFFCFYISISIFKRRRIEISKNILQWTFTGDFLIVLDRVLEKQNYTERVEANKYVGLYPSTTDLR